MAASTAPALQPPPATEDHVCRRCHEQDAAGRCRLRDRGECALYTYLPLVVDAIEEVKATG